MVYRIKTRLLCPLLALSLGLAGLSAGVAEAQAETHSHTVQPGETVQDIAAAYGLHSVSVMAANALANPDLLRVGQSLVIPSVDGVLHTVRSGDTLVAIAHEYDVISADLVSANALESADDLSVGEVLVVPGVNLAERAVQARAALAEAAVAVRDHEPAQTYVVQDGDTLRSIAVAFKLDILSLVAMNALDDPDVIRPGSRLQVSTQRLEHVVQPGDTLGDIAWRYSVDANALLRANGLEDPNRIVMGMTLVVPLGGPAAAAAAAPAMPPAPAAAPAAPPVPAVAAVPAAPSAPSAAVSLPSAAPVSAPTTSSKPRPAAPAPAAPAAAPRLTAGPMTAKVTGYALGAGAVSTHTASGTATHWGTVAADTRLYPFGTRLRIEGLGDTVFVVEDTGSAVRGNVFDVWFADAASARQLGARTREVTILAPAEP
ncbi:MAG: LysM peptidoglycan-binding domain-containing protein [Chloroflexi bacterium]|nr:LysM peptidoglycan-binding domain-containing protein [Chloroflexota bacterium]